MNKPNFWDDRRNSEQIINEFNSLTGIRKDISNLKEDIEEKAAETTVADVVSEN